MFLDLETLLRVPCVDPNGTFDISPDGKWVAFSWNRTGQWEIYEAPIAGNASLNQITSGPGAKFSPCYSPGGERLAYVVDLDGSEAFDLFVHDFASGKQINLTPDEPGSLQRNFSWSPDGMQIAYISNRSGHFDTYIMPSTGGPGSLALGLTTPDRDVHWSPDGRWLAVVTEIQGQDYGTYIVPVEGGEFQQISKSTGLLNTSGVKWSPDGTHLAFASDILGVYDIGLYELENGRTTWVTSGPGEKTSPCWSPDSHRLAYVYSQGELTSLVVLDLEKGSEVTYRVEPGVHYLPGFTPDGKSLVFVFDNPRHPNDLWRLSLEEGSFQQLTHSLPAELKDAPFVMPRAIRYPGMDGQSVPALLFEPPGAEKSLPAVVVIHGGPDWLFQFIWYPVMQHMASRGWVVLAPNYRGSTGYGREWQYANRYDLGGVDTRDVVAGSDYLVREGLADPRRIAVTGVSHGGYLTMTCLTQFPDRWVAGSAVVPFLNWFTAHANSRVDLQHWDIENFGDPEQNRDLWYARSPFFFLDRVQAPVQLICGANDPRCPASESIAAHDALLSLGKPVDFHLYPDEGHGFLRVENIIDFQARRVAFLAGAFETS
jgi:dipeptidyl aminopeptidase/acylaminoacyl peptidase